MLATLKVASPKLCETEGAIGQGFVLEWSGSQGQNAIRIRSAVGRKKMLKCKGGAVIRIFLSLRIARSWIKKKGSFQQLTFNKQTNDFIF
ncbi:MAG: hypothetical protein CMI29_10530 [Opitutae bacterium]|nr:hypothetical protein [Opitutae bacterium]|tara:strand:- start:1909 stop:2178 length:270 start_codon:yes stop_codon:yes gene_type:complete